MMESARTNGARQIAASYYEAIDATGWQPVRSRMNVDAYHRTSLATAVGGAFPSTGSTPSASLRAATYSFATAS